MRFQRVYRAHHPRWAFSPLSGEGAARFGGRFNRVGVPALYTSLKMPTAWLEAQQAFPFKAQPMTLCAYDVDCEDVLDLTDDAIRCANGIKPADLACPWEDLASQNRVPASWQLAERLASSGIAAIITPSFAAGARPDDLNLVLWSWGDALPHRVKVIDDGKRLPKDDRSWQ